MFGLTTVLVIYRTERWVILSWVRPENKDIVASPYWEYGERCWTRGNESTHLRQLSLFQWGVLAYGCATKHTTNLLKFKMELTFIWSGDSTPGMKRLCFLFCSSFDFRLPYVITVCLKNKAQIEVIVSNRQKALEESEELRENFFEVVEAMAMHLMWQPVQIVWKWDLWRSSSVRVFSKCLVT